MRLCEQPRLPWLLRKQLASPSQSVTNASWKLPASHRTRQSYPLLSVKHISKSIKAHYQILEATLFSQLLQVHSTTYQIGFKNYYFSPKQILKIHQHRLVLNYFFYRCSTESPLIPIIRWVQFLPLPGECIFCFPLHQSLRIINTKSFLSTDAAIKSASYQSPGGCVF